MKSFSKSYTPEKNCRIVVTEATMPTSSLYSSNTMISLKATIKIIKLFIAIINYDLTKKNPSANNIFRPIAGASH